MTLQKTKDQAQLISLIAQQDRNALSQLYDCYGRLVYAVAFKMLGSVEEAEEVVLDVFAQVWRSAASYNSQRSKVDTWLLMMARSRVLDRLRKRQRFKKVVNASMEVAEVRTSSTVTLPEENLLIQEKREQVLIALGKIPTEQRQAIELAYYQGLTQTEIATKTGVSLGTVKTRIRLGLSKLRKLLDID